VTERELYLSRLVRSAVQPGAITDIIELEKRAKLEELELTKLERLLEEEKRRLEQLRGIASPDVPRSAQPPLGTAAALSLMVANPRFAEVVKNMSDEDLMKLVLLTAALQGGGGQQSALALLPLVMVASKSNNQQPQQQRNPIEDAVNLTKALVETVRLLQPQQPQQPPQQMTASDVANLFKTVLEAVVALRQSQGQGQQQPVSPVSMLKEVAEALSVLHQVTMPSKELHEKIEKLERQIMRPDEWIKFIREQADLLGLKPGQVDKEVEKLRLELEKWRTEKELELAKWRAEQEADARKAEMVVQMLTQSPIASVVDKLTSAATQRLQQPQQGSLPNPRLTEELVVCPSCGHQFTVPKGSLAAICPKCGTLLRRVEKPKVAEVKETKEAKRQGTGAEGAGEQRKVEEGLTPPPPVVVGAEGG
jgi:predicted RNA-binding Zn-ribbon protein involved in translation (DUF1610 family)